MDLNNEFWIEELQRIGKVGIFSFNLRTGLMTASDVFYEMFGVSENFVKDKREWLNLIHPTQRMELKSYFQERIRTGEDFAKEFKLLYENDGCERWIELKGKVFFDEYDLPEKISGTIHDVSELKKSEKKYKELYMEYEEKEALLLSLINSIPDLIFYKDINRKYLGCNKAYANYLGVKEKDIIGRSDFDILGSEITSHGMKTDLKAIHEKEHCIYEEWVDYPNGKRLLLDTLKTPYYDPDGNILGIIGVSRDITERTKKEELQKKMKEERRRLKELKENDRIKTEFFTNISHELRTPINVIYSALQMEELMLKRCPSKYDVENKFKYINMMKQNCYRLLRLIENLIDITKFDNGYFNINESNGDIVSLVEEVVLSVAGYIENKDISVVFDTEIEEKIIAFDAEKMERVILNLLSNAVKFTPCGGNISVTIEDKGKNVCIKIKDTGTGIPNDKLKSIFERFVQVDKSFTRNHEGSGIGLSIVKSLVEQHDGTISAVSKVGEGTEFIINIPCKLIESKASTKNISGGHIKKSSIERINIEFSDIYN